MLYFNKITRSCLIFFLLFSLNHLKASETGSDFNSWLVSFKKQAIKKGISKDTLEMAFKNVKFYSLSQFLTGLAPAALIVSI